MRTYHDEMKNSQEYRLLKSRCYLIMKNRDDLNDVRYFYDHILNAHVTETYVVDRMLNRKI